MLIKVCNWPMSYQVIYQARQHRVTTSSNLQNPIFLLSYGDINVANDLDISNKSNNGKYMHFHTFFILIHRKS